MCREANLASSSSWIYIAYNIYSSLFISFGINMHLIVISWIGIIFVLDYPFLIFLFLTKRGRKFVFMFFFNPLLVPWLGQKGGEDFCSLYACLCMHVFVLRIKNNFVLRICFDFALTPLLMIDKKGEKNLCFCL